MNKLLVYITILLVTGIPSIYAQAPSTWTINPSDFNNSMVVTAVLNLESVESRNPEDVVAAFIGNDVRGVASPITYLSSRDRYVVNLVVYSNQSNVQITFKLYNKTLNKVTNAVNQPITFITDSRLGTLNSPFVIKDNSIPTAINLSSSSIDENKAPNTLIGAITVIDEDLTDTHVLSFLDGSGYEDNGFFEIRNGKLFAKPSFNYEIKKEYTIRIKAEDPKKGVVVNVITIQINDINDIPESIQLSNNSILENTVAPALIGILSTTDQDDTVFTYRLAPTFDYTKLQIVGDKIYIKEVPKFQRQALYEFEVISNDGSGGEIKQKFSCTIIDVNDPPILTKNPKFFISEIIAIGTEIGTIGMTDEDPRDSHVFELISTNPLPFKISNSGLITLDKALDFEKQTSYTFQVKVTDNGSPALSDITTVVISLKDEAEESLVFNNVITPNNDGFNDVLKIFNLQIYEKTMLTIYNSRGQLLFSSDNYQNNWGSSDIPTGVYYLYFSTTDKTGKEFIYKELLKVVNE
jgi:gliding motility-associated-like protein